LKQLSIILAILALFSGLYAAYLWDLSTKVDHMQGWNDSIVTGDATEDREVMKAWFNTFAVWIDKLSKAIRESGGINSRAARWTAISVVLGGFSSLLGASSA